MLSFLQVVNLPSSGLPEPHRGGRCLGPRPACCARWDGAVCSLSTGKVHAKKNCRE